MDKDESSFKRSTRPAIFNNVVTVEAAFYDKEHVQPKAGEYRIDGVSRCVEVRELKRLFYECTLDKYLEVGVAFDATNGEFDPDQFKLPKIMNGFRVTYKTPPTMFMG